MNSYAIVKDGVIENIIHSDAAFAKSIGALPAYAGAAIGSPYTPNTPAPADLREEAYNTLSIVAWDDEMLTVTQAAQLWQYYAAEGSEKAAQLQAAIAEAKAGIRAMYPDEEGAE